MYKNFSIKNFPFCVIMILLSFIHCSEKKKQILVLNHKLDCDETNHFFELGSFLYFSINEVMGFRQGYKFNFETGELIEY